MAAHSVIAVLDIGKTNKKAFLFNEQYQIVYEQSAKLPETADEDGDPCEDLEKLTTWVKSAVLDLQHQGFAVRAMNFSSYGASLVHTDLHGQPVLPLYNYLKPYPAELKQRFFNTYGGEKHVSQVTASPVLDSLNAGLQLYRLKFEKDLLSGAGYSLHLPQYVSMIATGRAYADITSIGCHTMLWDFTTNDYHQWVRREGVIDRLAPIFAADGAVKNPAHPFPMGIGLHDSSSALIPYLASFHQPFVLISTGTWCISLNPFDDTPLQPEELEQDCLCFMSYTGRRVKASRLFAGYEHEMEVKRMAAHFHTAPHYYESVQFSPETALALDKKFEQDRRSFLAAGPSAFSQRSLGDFSSYEEAYHQLIADIIRQQILSTRLVMNGEPVTRMFVDGGFGKNPVYMNLLAQAFPQVEVYAASVAQATALGAALAIHANWNGTPLPAGLIELKYYSSMHQGEKKSVSR